MTEKLNNDDKTDYQTEFDNKKAIVEDEQDEVTVKNILSSISSLGSVQEAERTFLDKLLDEIIKDLLIGINEYDKKIEEALFKFIGDNLLLFQKAANIITGFRIIDEKVNEKYNVYLSRKIHENDKYFRLVRSFIGFLQRKKKGELPINIEQGLPDIDVFLSMYSDPESDLDKNTMKLFIIEKNIIESFKEESIVKDELTTVLTGGSNKHNEQEVIPDIGDIKKASSDTQQKVTPDLTVKEQNVRKEYEEQILKFISLFQAEADGEIDKRSIFEMKRKISFEDRGIEMEDLSYIKKILENELLDDIN